MKRLNFTLDEDTVSLLEELAGKFYGGNKSQTVRAALESLATHTGYEGWVIAGYTPQELDDAAQCHSCGDAHEKGDILYRPVFEKGKSPAALSAMPAENWLDCPQCVEENVGRASSPSSR